MRPFNPGEAGLFHGRDREIVRLVRRLRYQSFLTVIGPSGVGKSSLLLAGLIPWLTSSHPGRWRVQTVRPGSRPLDALAVGLDSTPSAIADGAACANAVDELVHSTPDAARLLLVVDQMEEVFAQTSPSASRPFLDALNVLRRHGLCSLLVAIRADFYPDLMMSPLWPLADGERFEVGPMQREQLRQAIAQPAARMGVHVEGRLIERIIADGSDEPGALPLIQEAMVMLWEQRQGRTLTLRAYEAMGDGERNGLTTVLSTVADSALASMPIQQRAIAHRILVRLVQPGTERGDTRRQHTVDALRARFDDRALFDETVGHLARHRLIVLTGDEGSDARRVDLAHESLIHGWPTLNAWVNEDRDGLRIRHQLSNDAAEWEALNRNPGLVYRGPRLLSAVRWADRRPEELTDLEHAFMEAGRSLAIDHRERSVVASFAQIDTTRPEAAREEINRQVQTILADVHGALWHRDSADMILATEGSLPQVRLTAPASAWWDSAFAMEESQNGSPTFRETLSLPSIVVGLAGVPGLDGNGASEARASPIVVDQQVVGMLTVVAINVSHEDILPLVSVVAHEVSSVLHRLNLMAAMERQARALTSIMTHSPVGVVLEDTHGNVAYVNSEIERIYSVNGTAIIGTPVRHLLERPDAVVVSDPDAGPGDPLEVRLAESGTVVLVRQITIQGAPGEPDQTLSLHEDITQERAVLEAKDLMLRAIGHEVRSPAAAMRSTLAGLLQWGRVMDADQRHSLVVEAYEQSERLLSLVENQLIIARLEAHRLEPNRAPTALARTTEHVLTVLRTRYGDRVDVVDMRLSPDLPNAYCEPTHLDLVLSNLIGNALEYTHAGHIRVTGHADGPWLEVTVADDGDGLPPERVEQLFAKAGPAGQSRARGGLGLGLYLCHLVVERSFGGRIWLESTGASGTTFKFTVPVYVPGWTRRRT